MKKIFIAILLFAVLFSFVSCKDEPSVDPGNPGAVIPTGIPGGATVKEFEPDKEGMVISQMILDGQKKVQTLASIFDGISDDFDPSKIKDITGSLTFAVTSDAPTTCKYDFEYYKKTDDVYDINLTSDDVEITFSDFSASFAFVSGAPVISGTVKVGFTTALCSVEEGTEYSFTGSLDSMIVKKGEVELPDYGNEANDRPYGKSGKEFNDAMIAGYEAEVVEMAAQRSLLLSRATFKNFKASYADAITLEIDGDAALTIDITALDFSNNGKTDLTIGLESDNLKVKISASEVILMWEFSDFSVILDAAPKTVAGKSKYNEFDIDISIDSVKVTGRYDDLEIVGEIVVDSFKMEQGKYTNSNDERVLDKGNILIDASVGVAGSVNGNSIGIRADLDVDIHDDLEAFDAFDLGDAIDNDLKLAVARINENYIRDPEKIINFIMTIFED